MEILDVGCGVSKIKGALGVDFRDLPGVDLHYDLDAFPWPFEKDRFDKICFSHSISHLSDVISVIKECHRILKENGTIEIVAPHYSSDNSFTDPTIKHSFSSRSMAYCVLNSKMSSQYNYVSSISLHQTLAYISFRQAECSWRKKVKINPYKIIGFEFICNKFPRIYEKFFSFIIPATEVHFVLIKIPKEINSTL